MLFRSQFYNVEDMVDSCETIKSNPSQTQLLNATKVSGRNKDGLAIGFSGKGFLTEPYELIPGSHTSYNYTGGYGSFLIEPIVFPKFPVHVSFPILIGAGGIAKSILTNYNYPYDYTEVYVEDAEAFLIAEPGIELEFNVARWLRLGLGASYRFTTTFQPSGFDSNPMDGFTGGFSLKFGKF